MSDVMVMGIPHSIKIWSGWSIKFAGSLAMYAHLHAHTTWMHTYTFNLHLHTHVLINLIVFLCCKSFVSNIHYVVDKCCFNHNISICFKQFYVQLRKSMHTMACIKHYLYIWLTTKLWSSTQIKVNGKYTCYQHLNNKYTINLTELMNL